MTRFDRFVYRYTAGGMFLGLVLLVVVWVTAIATLTLWTVRDELSAWATIPAAVALTAFGMWYVGGEFQRVFDSMLKDSQRRAAWGSSSAATGGSDG